MRSGRLAVFVVFAINGAAMGSWAPRMPVVAEQINASAGALGLALLGASVGMIAAASFAGRWCARFGARALVLISEIAVVAVLPLLAIVGSPLQLGLVLVAYGASAGVLDVAMNIAAVTVVRRTGRPIMPVFHAGFSFGALAGSLAAALAAHGDMALVPHFLLVSAVVFIVAAATVKHVPREERSATTGDHNPRDRRMLRRPVLWLLGFVALFSAIVEGASADWSALFAVSERGMGEAAAAITFAVFSVSMALVRLFGEQAERRFGANRMLVGGALLAGVGLLLTAVLPVGAAAFAGFGFAGAGLAFAFPVALNMAGAAGQRGDGTGGEREIGFVTTIAYSGFLIGPPMIGGIAQLTNLTVAIGFAGIIAALIAPAALGAAAAGRHEQKVADEPENTPNAPAKLR